MSEIEERFYIVTVFCSNCEWGASGFSQIRIPVGVTLAEQSCPNCGCSTLQKVQKATL